MNMNSKNSRLRDSKRGLCVIGRTTGIALDAICLRDMVAKGRSTRNDISG